MSLSTMRGLSVFISNIRNCPNKEQERLRVDKELSNVRTRFKNEKDRLKKLKAEHGKVQLGNISVDMVLGGMRGMTGLLWETSLLDPYEIMRTRPLMLYLLQLIQ